MIFEGMNVILITPITHPHIPPTTQMHQQAMAAQEKDGQNRLKKLQKVNRFHVNGVSVSCMFPQLLMAF